MNFYYEVRPFRTFRRRRTEGFLGLLVGLGDYEVSAWRPKTPSSKPVIGGSFTEPQPGTGLAAAEGRRLAAEGRRLAAAGNMGTEVLEAGTEAASKLSLRAEGQAGPGWSHTQVKARNDDRNGAWRKGRAAAPQPTRVSAVE